MVLTQWDVLINMVNKLGSGLRHLKSTVGENLFESDHKLLTVDANLGRKPRGCGFENCASAWDGLAFMASQVKELGKDQVLAKDNIQTALESIDNRVWASVTWASDQVQARVDQTIGQMEQGLKEVAEFAKLFSTEQERLVETVIAAQYMNQTTGSSELQTLKAQMRLLEARLPNPNAGRLGGNLIQSRTDVLLFVEQHVPSNAFHLFHDVVT